MSEPSLKNDLVNAIVDAPGHLIRYVGGLVVAILGDYTLITLLVFVALLGLALESVLIAATAFFGLYFLLRLVANVADVIGYHANSVAGATARLGMAVERLGPPVEPPPPGFEAVEIPTSAS